MKKKPKCFPRENSGKILAKNAQKADRSAHDLPPFLEYTICMYLIQNARARPLYIPSSKLKYGKKGNLVRQILWNWIIQWNSSIAMMIWPVRAYNIVDFGEDWIWTKLTATVIWSIVGKAKNWVKTKRVIFLCGQFLRFVCKSSNSDGSGKYPLDHAGIYLQYKYLLKKKLLN